MISKGVCYHFNYLHLGLSKCFSSIAKFVMGELRVHPETMVRICGMYKSTWKDLLLADSLNFTAKVLRMEECTASNLLTVYKSDWEPSNLIAITIGIEKVMICTEHNLGLGDTRIVISKLNSTGIFVSHNSLQLQDDCSYPFSSIVQRSKW